MADVAAMPQFTLHALHGTFIGFPSDHLGMDVQVSVTSGTPEAIWPLLNAPRGQNSANRFGGRGQGK
jgi:hypothetical protein